MTISSTIGTQVAANHMKTKGSGHFGTRELQHIVVYTAANTMTNYKEPNSLYAQLVRAIQNNAELYAVGVPGVNFPTSDPYNEHAFTVIVAFETAGSWANLESVYFDGDPNDIAGGLSSDFTSASNPYTKVLADVVADCLAYNGLPHQEMTDFAVVWAPLIADMIVPAAPALKKA